MIMFQYYLEEKQRQRHIVQFFELLIFQVLKKASCALYPKTSLSKHLLAYQKSKYKS